VVDAGATFVTPARFEALLRVVASYQLATDTPIPYLNWKNAT
jgi:hypothetical protein